MGTPFVQHDLIAAFDLADRKEQPYEFFRHIADSELLALDKLRDGFGAQEYDGPDVVATRVAMRVMDVMAALTLKPVPDEERVAQQIAGHILQAEKSDFEFADALVESGKAAWSYNLERMGMRDDTSLVQLVASKPKFNLGF